MVLNLKASTLATPVATAAAPPRLNIDAQSLLISVNSSLAAVMAVAEAAGAATQLLVQPRLVTAAASVDESTVPARLGVVSTVLTAALSAADTSPPAVDDSLKLLSELALPSASTTHWVFSPALPVAQPMAPVLANCETAVSITARDCSFCELPVAEVLLTSTKRGSKPSNWLEVEIACVALAAVMPPLALAAAAAAISLNGVTVTVVVMAPLVAGTSKARIAKPTGRAWGGVPGPAASSACTVPALAVTLIT